MAAEIAPFTVHRNNILLVKPSKPTPPDLHSFSSIDNNPNFEIHCQTIFVYRANEGSPITEAGDRESSKLDPARVIEEALSKVLSYYYPLAGKLKRNIADAKLQIDCTGEGVPYLEATADCALESLSYFDGGDVEVMKHFTLDMPGNDTDGIHPLLIQVTKFACGGFTLGMGLYHTVSDGFGASMFLRAMAEFASGKSECTVKPVWERERLVGKTPTDNHIGFPIGEASFASSPFLLTTDLVHESFSFGADSLKRLKTSLSKEKGVEDINESFTTLEVVSAYIWRARFKALELNIDGKTFIAFALGIRHLLDPPLPEGYYGNAFASSNVTLTGKDLVESPLSRVARLIKESKRKTSKQEYIMSWLDFLEGTNQHIPRLGATGASLVLTDWRQLGLSEVDFGWKEAVNVIPTPWNQFGYVDLCIFLPPSKLNPSLNGGIRVLVCLPRSSMIKFKQEIDALNIV